MNFKILKYLSFIVIFIFYTPTIYAQKRGKCPSSKNKKSRELYTEAIRIQGVKSKSALKMLNAATRHDKRFVDAYYLSGRINYDKALKENDTKKRANRYAEAIKFFKKTILVCRSFDEHKAFFFIAKSYYNQKKYRKSKPYFEDFIKFTSAFVKRGDAELLLKNVNEYIYLVDNPVAFKPYKLPGISTPTDDEYLPTLSPDNELFFFTRKVTDKTNNYKEYFSASKKLSKRTAKKEVFSKGKPLSAPFNDGRNQGGATLTVDNKNLYFTICGIDRTSSNSFKNCDIYHVQNNNGEWAALEKVSANINGAFSFEGQPSITPDGKTMYFASYRKGGYGEMDIYCSKKDKNGNWGKAYNLGPEINTAKNDKTPFIHADGKTLYFASDGWFGMGGFDIFYTTHSKSGGWSTPKSIGYPINSESDELAFAISTDGIGFTSPQIHAPAKATGTSSLVPCQN